MKHQREDGVYTNSILDNKKSDDSKLASVWQLNAFNARTCFNVII